jgi:hypothetical protein
MARGPRNAPLQESNITSNSERVKQADPRSQAAMQRHERRYANPQGFVFGFYVGILRAFAVADKLRMEPLRLAHTVDIFDRFTERE